MVYHLVCFQEGSRFAAVNALRFEDGKEIPLFCCSSCLREPSRSGDFHTCAAAVPCAAISCGDRDFTWKDILPKQENSRTIRPAVKVKGLAVRNTQTASPFGCASKVFHGELHGQTAV
ncbi:hypothetical protein [Pseudoflavonifractor phocaeensis]|uniref:hypothetical protein n=1 Tax=Pseudoflavonifractor phocaeensis TaxID=1870988 RepID=UPI00195D459A|nr:hypothetical protein [Pseudoflavonifractor phocaeensis]